MRRRRIGQAVELRKAKKEDQLLKRRNIADVDESALQLQEQSSTSPTAMSAEDILFGKINYIYNCKLIAFYNNVYRNDES